MLRVLNIAWKDVRHVYRDIAVLVMMFAAPLALAGALGAAFGSGDNFSIAAVKTVVVDQDEGAGAGVPAAGATLTASLTGPDMADLLVVTQMDDPEAARAAVDDSEAAVAVIIPSNLSSALMSAGPGDGPAGPTADIQLYKDPALSVGPSIVAAVTESVIQSLNGARAAGATAARLGLSLGLTDTDSLSALASQAAAAYAQTAQTEPPVVLEARGPVVASAETEKRPNVASQVLVGMMLFFMLFGAATPARSVLDEHRQGTLPRLFTTPTPRSLILGGKYVAVFLVVLIQAAVLLLVGRFLMGADWGEPGPVVVLTLCSALVAASLGLVTVSFAKTPGQAGAVSSAIFVFLGLISGNFMGTANIGGTFAVVRRVSPLGWLMEGWSDLLYGGSWSNIVLPVAAAMSFTVVLFAVSTFFFRRRYA
ncbi:MAG: ABC transporter permease [Actinobacteria bacterium]|nr:ABC transporter permease [Actinomycetota bacterium]